MVLEGLKTFSFSYFFLHLIVLLPSTTESTLVSEYESEYSRTVSILLDTLGENFQGCEFVCVNDNHFSQSPNRINDIKFYRLHNVHAGVRQVVSGANITYPKHKDIHRLSNKHCSFGLFLFQEFSSVLEEWLIETVIPRYGPIMRKDQDHFLFFVPNENISNEILTSLKFGIKIKCKLAVYQSEKSRSTVICKTVDLYGNNGLGQLTTLKEFDTQNLEETALALKNLELFPDMTKQFNGKVFRFAIPKVAFRFEIEKRSDGKYHPKRGFYKWWLDEAMMKFNFTYEMFYASFGGGTGKLLKNNTWVGATGDLFYGKADCAFIVGEIYSRHKFLGWSASISYEWVIFITHTPRISYSAKAIFKPFTILMWCLFFIAISLMTFTLRQLARFNPSSKQTNWSYFKILSYVLSTFFEQDAQGPFMSSSTRVLCAFWLLFAMVTATAYRGKLVSLIAFPVNTWIPRTFEELANSNFKVALNTVGKAGAAYVLIASSTSPVFHTLASKMELIPEAENCLQRAMDEDLGCIIWKGISDYAMVKNLTDRNGHVPLQESAQIALFIGDGLVYERRAIFGEHLDRTIQAVVQMGLTIKWFILDQEFIKMERKIYENSRNITQKVYDYDDGPKKLVVSQFVGLFLLCLVSLILSCGGFGGEIYWHRRNILRSNVGGNDGNGIKHVETIGHATTSSRVDYSSNSKQPLQSRDVRLELYDMNLKTTYSTQESYFHYN